MKLFVAAALAALTASPALAAGKPIQLAYEVQQSYVYCIEDETSVEQWDLEQMKVRRGSDVCLLYTDTSASDAQNWMDKNFPDHKCFCDN